MESGEDHPALTLRPAQPTHEEGLAFAHFLDEAAEGFFHFLLGKDAESTLAAAFVQPDHDMSYRNVTFAELDGVIVGMICGYTAEQHRRSKSSPHNPLKATTGWRGLRLRVIQLLLAPLMRIIDSIDAGDFYLLAIAVDEDYRGRRVGAALADAAEQQARTVGATRLALDVAGSNARARRFYERRGMTIASRWPRRIPLPALKFYRMTKPV